MRLIIALHTASLMTRTLLYMKTFAQSWVLKEVWRFIRWDRVVSFQTCKASTIFGNPHNCHSVCTLTRSAMIPFNLFFFSANFSDFSCTFEGSEPTTTGRAIIFLQVSYFSVAFVVASNFVLLYDIWLCNFLSYEKNMLENLKHLLKFEYIQVELHVRPNYKYYLACF